MRILKHVEVALEREVEGDLFLQDIGQGLGFRPGSFDGAIRFVYQKQIRVTDRRNGCISVSLSYSGCSMLKHPTQLPLLLIDFTVSSLLFTLRSAIPRELYSNSIPHQMIRFNSSRPLPRRLVSAVVLS